MVSVVIVEGRGLKFFDKLKEANDYAKNLSTDEMSPRRVKVIP